MVSGIRLRLARVPREAWAALLLALLVALFFWRFLTPKPEDRVAFPGGDFTDQFYAWRLYEGRELMAGRLPLWSPYFNSGHPFLADVQAAVFYPIGLAVTWIGSMGGDLRVEVLQLEAFAHFLLAGWFTYLFVRRLLGRGRGGAGTWSSNIGAVLAAVTFTFGGYLTSSPPLQLAVLETVTWLPLFLLALDSAAERPTARSIGGAALVLAVAVFAGHTQTLLFILYGGAAFYAFRAWSAWQDGVGPEAAPWPFVIRRAGALAAVLILGGALSAVQLLPSLEYVSLSTRSGLGFAESATGMPPLQMIQMLVPGSVSAFASPLYVGVLPLWLAASAVAARRDRQVAFWLLLAVLALVDMLGGFSFFYGLVYLSAPGFALFRGQERAACLFSFALAVLAAYGTDPLLHDLPRRAKTAFLGSFRVLAWTPLAGLILTLFYFYAIKTAEKPGSFVFLVDRAALMTLLTLLAATLAAARLWGWLRLRAFGVLAVVLVVFDLFTINWYNNQSPPKPRFPSTPVVQTILADGELFRTDAEALPGHAGAVFGFQDVEGASPLRLRAYDELWKALPEDKSRSLLGVRYVATAGPAPVGGTKLSGGAEGSFYKLPSHMPRAWLTTEVRVAGEGKRALAAMADPGFDPLRTAVLEREPSTRPDGGLAGTAAVSVYEAERLVVETASAVASVLVLSENYYPGWRATVDGAPAEILRADHALRAVALAAGDHRVEMFYQPDSLRVGALLSAASVIALGAVLWATGRERRRR